MATALGLEGRYAVSTFLTKCVEAQLLSYKFSIQTDARPEFRTRVRVTFSKPTREMPSPEAVAHFFFQLDKSLQRVKSFTVESDPHVHILDPDAASVHWDDRVVDHVIRRKQLLKQQHLVNLHDDFSSTRVPERIHELQEEKFARDRENTDELMLEGFQRKDPYNEGRLPMAEFRETLYDLHIEGVGSSEREVLLALVDQDRDEMVDYGAFLTDASEFVETLRRHHRMHRPGTAVAQAKATQESKDQEEDASSVVEDYIDWFRNRSTTQVHHTINTLHEMLRAFEPAAVAAAVESGTDGAEESEAIDGNPHETEAEADPREEDELAEAENAQSQAKPELFITRQQLRSCLDSPQLLISKAESNLLLALVEVDSRGKIACSPLGALYQHVRDQIFQFQCLAFKDDAAEYLLRQFKDHEASLLQGTAQHLKLKLTQKAMKLVVRSMTKLLLTPYQVMQLASLYGTDEMVNYKQYVPVMARFLEQQVDMHLLAEDAEILHFARLSERLNTNALPSPEEFKQVCSRQWEAMDQSHLGVLSLDEFGQSLDRMAEDHGISFDSVISKRQLCVLADPTNQGRVNYQYFQQLIHPLTQFILQEQLLEAERDERRRRRDDPKPELEYAHEEK